MKGRKRKPGKGSPVPDWSDPNAATPLQSLKFVKQLGQRNERAARHRARNRPSDN
jgi:hypothetical protein